MRIRATKFFISTAFGNVDVGRILDVSEGQGKHLIEHGLASVLKEAGPVDGLPKVQEKQSSFSLPVEAKEAPGSSLPAGQVSQKKIVNASESGVKPKRVKSGRSR